MTGDFESSGVIENAGHSSVHRAVTSNGKLLAVKRAKKMSKEGDHMFKNEVSPAPPRPHSPSAKKMSKEGDHVSKNEVSSAPPWPHSPSAQVASSALVADVFRPSPLARPFCPGGWRSK